MGYNNNIIQTLGVDDESSYPHKLGITVAVDTLGMCTISFGTNYSIRIPEDDVDALRDVLYGASRQLMATRNRKAMLEAELESLEEPYHVMCEYCQDTYDMNDRSSNHICNNESDERSYEEELMSDNSHYEGEWQPYKSHNR